MLDKLKSIFIVEEEGAGKTKKVVQPTTTKVKQRSKKQVSVNPQGSNKDTSSSKESSSPTTSSQPSTQSKPDGKFVDVLLKAIEANNLEGFDYLEYKQSLQNLSSMSMDEKTKYQSAFAMAKTMGVSSGKLIETANHYLKVLKNEEQKFGTALQNQTQTQVVNKEQELKQMEQAIIQKQKQIEQLQKEIEEHKTSLQGRTDVINQAAAKVEQTKNNFIYAFNIVAKQIQKDIENIKKYVE